jgi:hypothetical protein
MEPSHDSRSDGRSHLLPGKSLRVESAFPNVVEQPTVHPVVQVQLLKLQKGVNQQMWPVPYTGPCDTNAAAVCDERMPVLTHACSFADANQNCSTEMPLEKPAAFAGGGLLTVDLNVECKRTWYCQAGGDAFATVVCSVDLK